MHYTTGEILSVCGSHGSMKNYFKIFKKSMRKLKFKPFLLLIGLFRDKEIGFWMPHAI